MDTKNKKILLFAKEKLWVANNSCNEMKEMVPGLTKKKFSKKYPLSYLIVNNFFGLKHFYEQTSHQ
jgi:hypothetical protein